MQLFDRPDPILTQAGGLTASKWVRGDLVAWRILGVRGPSLEDDVCGEEERGVGEYSSIESFILWKALKFEFFSLEECEAKFGVGEREKNVLQYIGT